MIRVNWPARVNEVGSEYPDDVVWEALRRGILEQIKVVVVKTSWDDLETLRKEMANPEHAAPEGGDVPDDEAMT